MKKKEILLLLSLCLLLNLVFLGGCKSGDVSIKETKETDETNRLNFVVETESEEESEEYERVGAFNQVVDNENIFEKERDINFDGIIYSDFSIRYAKKLPENIKKNEVTYFEEKVDENGKLLGDEYYVFCKVTIENTTKSTIEVDLSGGKVAVLDENNAIYDSSQELRYRSGDKLSENDKDYYFSKLKSGEKKQYTLCYIVNKVILESENIYYILNPNGEAAGYAKLMAYKVK